MQEKEQKQFDKDAQKKALIGNGIILFVLVIGIILAVFCWFSVLEDKATARGISVISNDNLDIRFNTYPGIIQSNGTIIYDENPLKNLNNPDFDEDANLFSMYPGERKYFKTVISNYELSNHRGTFTLQSLLVNKKLVTTSEKICITFGSNLEGGAFQQSFDLKSAQDYYEGGVLSNTFRLVGTQPIYEDLLLPAAVREQQTGNVSATAVTVYWYVLLNGDVVENDVMGEQMLKLQNIKFIATS